MGASAQIYLVFVGSCISILEFFPSPFVMDYTLKEVLIKETMTRITITRHKKFQLFFYFRTFSGSFSIGN